MKQQNSPQVLLDCACSEPAHDQQDSFFSPRHTASSCHQFDMFACQPVSQRVQDLDLGRVLTPDFEEDEELAAARDLITADLKVVLETDCAHGAVAMCKSTPPPPSLGMLQQHTSAVAMGHMQHHHQEASGAAGSSCGASSPQASCDTAAARAQQQFWTSAQQYDAAYGLVLAHSPPASHYAAAPPHMGGGAAGPYSAGGMACAGPCCNPSANLLPQGSSSLAGLPDFSSSMLYGGAYGPAGMSAGMVPHAAFGGNSSSVVISRSTPVAAPMHSGPGGVPAPPPAAMRGPQRVAASNYPPVQGGVLKKSASGVRLAIKAEPDSRPSQRRSADGSCSSQDGTPVPPSKARKGAASKAGTAGAASGGRSRASATSGAAVAGNASSSSLIKELQQEIQELQAAKTQLRTQVRTLLTSQTDLLGRVTTLTTKWQAAVAENAALHRQNLQLAAAQAGI